MSRDNFKQAIKNALAARAAYQCSIPECRKSTIGPGKKSDKAIINTGVAAHIHGASPGGPRYDPSLTPQQRSDISNGIWLCAMHGSLIDRDEQRFPAEQLKKYKRDHEKYISFVQSGLPQGKGFFSRISVSNLGPINTTASVNLSNITIILGNNSTGKTLFCECLASLHNSKYLERWLEGKDRGKSIIEIDYFSAEAHTFKVVIHGKKPHYMISGVESALVRPACHIHYLRDPFECHRLSSEKSKLSQHADYFGLSYYELCNLFRIINDFEGYCIRDIYFEISDEELIVNGASSSAPRIPYQFLCRGEQGLINVEIVLRYAELTAKFVPTVVILEQGSSGTLHNIYNFLELLRSRKFPFQILLTFYEWYDYWFKDMNNAHIWELFKTDSGVECREYRGKKNTSVKSSNEIGYF